MIPEEKNLQVARYCLHRLSSEKMSSFSSGRTVRKLGLEGVGVHGRSREMSEKNTRIRPGHNEHYLRKKSSKAEYLADIMHSNKIGHLTHF